jgi:hypothetical protein
VRGGLEPSHLSLALARRLMRDFGSIVFVLLRAVHDRRHHHAVGSRVAAQLVRNQKPWLAALPFQQFPEEAFGRTAIAPWLKEDIDHVAVLIHGPPEILLVSLDVHEQFVQMPGVAQASLPTPEDTSVGGTEGETPLPNRLVGYGDAALGEKIFGISKAQTEPVVEPNGVTDDLCRESVAVVAGGRARHQPTLPVAAST